jgi:competence protein ComEA
VVTFLFGVAAGALIVSLSGRSSPSPIIISTALPPSTSEPTTTPAPIKVFVSGEVANPAVYELPAGAIIQDLVRSAGGFTESAVQDVVNQALTLSDGMHIHVPGQEQDISIPVVSGGAGAGGLSGDGAININLATLQDLETLPGIGPSLAQAIIDHRELIGSFNRIEDITDVPGIGPAKFEALKDLITVE